MLQFLLLHLRFRFEFNRSQIILGADMKLDRRHFIQNLALSAGTIGLAGKALTAEPGQRRIERIGVINGVPRDAKGDWQTALKQMASFGYTELESGLRGSSPDEFLKFLNGIGLTLVSCGISFGLRTVPGWLDRAVAMKVRYATTFWPWYHSLDTLTLDQLNEIADRLNRCGEECRKAGLKMAVHNHDGEFRKLDGKPIFDRLIELTDPKLVAIELDIYWAVKAGADPLDYFNRYPGRFELLHIKDMGPPPNRGFVAIGDGTINWAKIFAESEKAGVKHYIVELEKEASTTENFRKSCQYLQRLRF